MISADKERLFPRFLLDDVTGNAMAAAVTRGLEYFCQVLDDGIGQLTDPDRMSESGWTSWPGNTASITTTARTLQTSVI